MYPVGDWLPAGVATLSDALRALVGATPQQGYLAVQAYLDRVADASAAVLRTELARRTQLQTTFGWGPRFLHSTGQYHKGGHQNGAFLQLTGAVDADIPVPGTGFTLGELQQAQALGDADVLAAHGRPVLRLHLLDRAAGLVRWCTRCRTTASSEPGAESTSGPAGGSTHCWTAGTSDYPGSPARAVSSSSA